MSTRPIIRHGTSAVFLLLVIAALAAFSPRRPAREAPAQCASRPALRIVSPANLDSVGQQPIVEGTATQPGTDVWVIVHPMALTDSWVQQAARVQDNCRWRVQVNIGQPGSAHIGQHFQLMVVARPSSPLHEGQVLSGWPRSRSHSQILQVIRKGL